MIIGSDYVFISVPKCATHSMFTMLTEQFGGVHAPGPFHGRQVPPEDEGKFRFTIVRDPYERAVSAWSWVFSKERYAVPWGNAIGSATLEEWLKFVAHEDVTKLPGHELGLSIHRYLGDLKFDHVIKLEELDIAELPFVTGEYKMPWELNRRAYNCVDLTPSVRRLIEEWAGSDFETYGYGRK